MIHDKTNLADRLISAEGGYLKHEHQHIGGAALAALLIEKMSLRPGQVILDLGCGVGATVRQMADLGLGPLYGVDRNADLIATARDLCHRTGRGEGAEFICADALRMPFKSETFDAIITIHLGMMIADKAMLYSEAARVLKRGGVLGILDITLGRAGDDDLTYPLPWADTRQQNFLCPAADLAATIAACGFDSVVSEDYSAEAKKILSHAVDLRFASILLGVEGRARVENLTHGFANHSCTLSLILARRIGV